MINIEDFSKEYSVRKLNEEDSQKIIVLEKSNPQYFTYCPPQPSIQSIKKDLVALPPKKKQEDKYYIGFFQKDVLIAVMDLILAYPDQETVFIGFFMVNKEYSLKGIGSKIIYESLNRLKNKGFKYCRLGYMKGNIQSKNFWNKCKFFPTGIEITNDRGEVVILQREL